MEGAGGQSSPDSPHKPKVSCPLWPPFAERCIFPAGFRGSAAQDGGGGGDEGQQLILTSPPVRDPCISQADTGGWSSNPDSKLRRNVENSKVSSFN